MFLTGKRSQYKYTFLVKGQQKLSAADFKKLENTVRGLLKVGWDVRDIAKNLGIDEKIILKIKDNISNN